MKKNNLVHADERLDDLELNDLMIIQNPSEYLFTSDSVALSNFAKCKKGDVVVELCSGSGVIGILMNEKYKPAQVHMVELQKHLADMCERTLQYNGTNNIVVYNRPLQDFAKEFGYNRADVVVVNPPYKCTGNKQSEKQTINIAKHEIKVTLDEVICEAHKLLKFGGAFYMVNKIERLTDIMCTMRKYSIEPKTIKLLSNSVLISGISGGKSGVKVIK